MELREFRVSKYSFEPFLVGLLPSFGRRKDLFWSVSINNILSTNYLEVLFLPYNIGSSDTTIRICDANSLNEVGLLRGHTYSINSLVLYGNKLFSGQF